VALSLLTINELFHWGRQRDWWSGVRCAAAVLPLLLAHLNGVYTVAFLVLLLAVEAVSAGWSGARTFLWESRTLWIPLAGVAIIVGVAYWRLLPDIVKVNREWGTDTPPTSMGYLPQVFTSYVGAGYSASLCALLLLAGCWSAAREKRGLLLLCGAIMVGLRPLFNFFSSLTFNLNGGRNRLACETRPDAERRRSRSLGPHSSNYFMLDALRSRAVPCQETVAV
jgi:hypothetical protein